MNLLCPPPPPPPPLPGGDFCGTPGSDSADGPCSVGYYCEYGVDTATPSDGGGHTGVGGECPAGSYCPLGSERPISCAAGTYTTTTSELS